MGELPDDGRASIAALSLRPAGPVVRPSGQQAASSPSWLSEAARYSALMGRVQAARGLLAGGLDPDEIAEIVRRRGARVVHAHNIHPLFGWRALAAARGVPRW